MARWYTQPIALDDAQPEHPDAHWLIDGYRCTYTWCDTEFEARMMAASLNTQDQEEDDGASTSE